MIKNKKVLFLINKFGLGGAERVFIKDIQKLSQEGYDVLIGLLFSDATQDDFVSQLSIDSKNIYICNSKNIYDIGALVRLRSFIIKSGIEVVYSTLNEANIFSRLIKISLPRLRVVIREANIAGPKPLHFKIFDFLANIWTDRIVCVSEEVRDSLCAYQPWFRYKMEVIMNGVVIPEKSKVYSEVLPQPLHVLNVGSLTSKKGQKYLIDACAEVLKQRPSSIILSIYGKGVEENNLNSLIQWHGLENNIHIHKPVSPEEISRVYSSSDIFVLSSIHEGCPNVLLEAMAHGLACISTKVSGAVSIIIPDSGILAEVGSVESLTSSIVSIIDEYHKIPFFGMHARDRMIKEFSMDAHIKKLINILYI